MDLIDKLRELAKTLKLIAPQLKTEEATKNALIMPFIQSLGYNVFNPLEVIPEYTADHGVKQGEKVDYLIKKDNEPTILIECKKYGNELDLSHASQLYRYFSVSKARIGILTNGRIYKFFSDLDRPNQMDTRPFFVFDLAEFEPHEIEEIKKFAKNSFELDKILETANDLKYTNAVKKILQNELTNPSDEFVRFFASKIYTGRLTQNVMEQFKEIVKKARKQFINEQVNERLQSALSTASNEMTYNKDEVSFEETPKKDSIVTTDDEMDAYNIVRAISRQNISVERVNIRDTKSYCGVLLDDNNRKPICRFHFNGKQYYIGLFNDKVEEKIAIDMIDQIYDYSDKILTTIEHYK